MGGECEWHQFPPRAQAVVDHFRMRVVQKIDGLHERMWIVAIDKAKFCISWDTWVQEVSIMAWEDTPDAEVERLMGGGQQPAMDDLEGRVRSFVHELVPWLPLDVPMGADLIDDAGIDGDDVEDLVEEFGKRFGVRMEGFRWYHHSGMEGCNPLWLVFRPWWARKSQVPIRISDLVESARRGAWVAQYPEDERER